ncbi:hypothetical protein C8J57DRAFT_1555324 [Mycena rebaudengoi]|nr:hypothetical protein C8J57DRAFT_1555324 [Mycena rebaudengoi]
MDDAAHHRGMAEQVFRQELQKIVEGERVERRKDIEELNSELNSKFKADFKNKNVLSLQNRLLTLTEHIVHLNDVTERYETVARTIQGMTSGLNDVIFDVDREARNPHDIILSEVEKDMLKRHGLGYLTQLLQPPKNLPAEIEGLRLRALSILTPQQLKLCQVLAEQDSDGQRNFLQHPRPDCRTVMDQVGVFLDADTRDTLHKLKFRYTFFEKTHR